MKISTVTVCFNAQDTIAHTVRSFIAQAHTEKELLVIDGGSTDRTLDIVHRLADESVRIISEKDNGIYDAMNKGLALSSGDAVGFLNADDIYHDASVLGRLAGALEDADAAYGDLVMISDHDSRKIVRQWHSGDYVTGSFRKGWMPPHPTFYVRRELARKTGTFNLRYRISADYDFMLRAMELHHPRVSYIPHVLVDFMVGGMSTKNPMATIRGNIECLRSRRENLGTPPVDAAFIMKPLRKLQQLSWR